MAQPRNASMNSSQVGTSASNNNDWLNISNSNLNRKQKNIVQSCFSLYYTNAHSIANKFEEIDATIFNYNPDFIFITETWLSPFYDDTIVAHNHYDVFRKDRCLHSGGGVIIYSHVTMNNRQIQLRTEFAHCDIVAGINNYFIFMCIYRPPSKLLSNLLASLNEVCSALHEIYIKCTNQTPIIITGDFNLPELFNKSHCMYPYYATLYDLIKSINLIQIVNFNTRMNNILDLIFISKGSKYLINTAPNLSTSDHVSINVKLNTLTQCIYKDSNDQTSNNCCCVEYPRWKYSNIN